MKEENKYTIKNFLNSDGEIDIFGDISGWWGYNTAQLRYDLEGVSSNDITVNISTYGGDVFEALAISGILSGLNKQVTTVGYGIVASAGTVLLLAGNKVKMSENAFFMIHNPSAEVGGEAGNLRDAANLLDKIQQQLIKIYVDAIEKNNKLINGTREATAKQVEKWINAETWLTAPEALEIGFIDEITESVEFITPTNAVPIQNSIAAYQKVPAVIKNKLSEFKITETMQENQTGILEAIKNLFVSAGLIKPTADGTAEVADTNSEAEIAAQAAEAAKLATAEAAPPAPADTQSEKDILLQKIADLSEKIAKLETAPPPSAHARVPEPINNTSTMPKEEAEQWGKLLNPIKNKLK